MHIIKDVSYLKEYRLVLEFEDCSKRVVDLKPYLDGEIFEPLRDVEYFKKVYINHDIDTIMWDNGADMSPDFLFEISMPLDKHSKAIK